jgi:hypothetical protein
MDDESRDAGFEGVAADANSSVRVHGTAAGSEGGGASRGAAAFRGFSPAETPSSRTS